MFNVKSREELVYDIGSNKYSFDVFSQVRPADLDSFPLQVMSINPLLHHEKCKQDVPDQLKERTSR